MINFFTFIYDFLTVIMVGIFFGFFFFAEEGLVGFRHLVETCGQ